jgi:uncharacterized protein YukE
MASKIKIVPADFQKTVVELHRVKALLHDYNKELSSKYSKMRNEWQGLAGDAFEVCGQKVLESFEMNIEGLNRLAVDIEKASRFMEDVDQTIAGQIAGA